MTQTAADQSTISSDFNAMPDVWKPVWTTPSSILLAIASGIALYTAVVISCLLAFAAIFGIVLCLFSSFYIEMIIVALTAFYPLIGFLLYTPGKQRRIIAIVISIMFIATCAISIALEMYEFINMGIVCTFLLHGSALSGLTLGNYSARIASPNRWHEIHLNNKHCPRCRYDIRNLPTPRCPECGETFEAGFVS